MTESADVSIAKKALAPYLKRIGYDDGVLVALENFAAAIRNEERRKMESLLGAALLQPSPTSDLVDALKKLYPDIEAVTAALSGVVR